MRWGVIIVILLFFVLACKPVEVQEIVPASEPVAQPAVTVEPSPEPVAEPAVTVEPAAEPAPEEVIYNPPVEEQPSIAMFVSHFKNEVKNYKFTYHNDIWYVQGKNAKIILFRVLKNEYHAPFIDTVYIDLERRTATGMCEGRDTNIKKQCAIQDQFGKKYSLPYVQFKIKLPEDWLYEFQSLFTSVAETPQLVTDRDTVHLKHLTKTRSTDLWIDPSIGLPIAVIDDSAEYHYDSLAKNQFGADTNVMPVG